MKNLLKLAILLLALLLPATATAHSFEVDGIYYNILNGNEVAVTYRGEYYDSYDEYSGSVTIPSSVTYYGTTYFVKRIGKSAFESCSGLTSVTIPNSVTSIGNYVFSGCTGLNSITVASGNPVYDSRNNCNAIIETTTNTLIAGCKNTIIPNTVTSIGYSAFEYCSGLTSIDIPNSVTTIGNYAFYRCTGLTNITIPNSVTSIGDEVFWRCSGLTSVTIPNSVTTIGQEAFEECTGLTSIDIPNSVTTIGFSAFRYCRGLTSITIPNSVTTIGVDAFNHCSALNEVYSYITDLSSISMGSNVFYRDPANYDERTLYVPTGTLAAYQADAKWSEFFGNIVEIGSAPGDVTGDGQVSIADVTAMIDLLLTGGTPPAAADVTGDGNVTIADVTALIDYLLTSNWPSNARTVKPTLRIINPKVRAVNRKPISRISPTIRKLDRPVKMFRPKSR